MNMIKPETMLIVTAVYSVAEYGIFNLLLSLNPRKILTNKATKMVVNTKDSVLVVILVYYQ